MPIPGFKHKTQLQSIPTALQSTKQDVFLNYPPSSLAHYHRSFNPSNPQQPPPGPKRYLLQCLPLLKQLPLLK